jgi:hypothetical protein
MKKYHHMFPLFGLGAYAVVVAICSLIGQYGCSASSPQGAPSTVSSSTSTTTATDPVDGFDFLHGKVSTDKPTPNPWWYGQGPYAKKPVMANTFSGSFGPPVYQTSWAQAAWYIDPANSTTCASDTNKTCSLATCGTAGDGPCLTYAQVAARWGTYAPRIRQATVVTFLSSQTDNTDPVIWKPYVENGGYTEIMAALPTAAQTGTLASVVAKNRATPQLLNATIGAGGVTGQLIVNTTHPSRAFLYTNSAGNAWNMTQPLAPLTIPFNPFSAGTEVDTWANGDAFSVYTPYTVNIVDYEPTWVAGVTSVTGDSGFIYQTSVPATGQSPQINLNANVIVLDSVFNPTATVSSTDIGTQGFFEINVYDTNSLYYSGPPVILNSIGSFFTIRGGFQIVMAGQSVSISRDTIFGLGASGFTVGLGNALLSNFYISATNVIAAYGITQVTAPVWGPGTLSAAGQGRIKYPSGGGAAAANLLTTSLQINEANTACSHTAASPDVVSCGITVSAANLDAAQGVAGFGGLAYVPGGGSITNLGL